MIAYGIKTWKSIAMPAVLFLGLSVFLFLQAVKMNLTIRDEVEEYGQITCYINETAQERLLEQKISEVFPGGKGSFVYEFSVILQCNSISKEINVTGIETQMIPGTLVSGRYYEDNVSTPEIVMNMTAFSDLWREDAEIMGMNAADLRGTTDSNKTGAKVQNLRGNDASNTRGNDAVEMSEADSGIGRTLIMGNCGAKLCGIIDDGVEIPSIYISVPAAKAYLKQQGEVPKAASYCVRIPDLKTLRMTQEKMNTTGIATSVDDSKLFQWELMECRRKDYFFMGMIALAAFVSDMALSIKWRQQLETLRSMRVYAVRVGMCLWVGCILEVTVYMLASLWYVE